MDIHINENSRELGLPVLTSKYRIGMVSRLTGLSADVVRVWERRYAAITPPRSNGGSRLYSDADIARLRRLRRAVEAGHAISQVANLPDGELDALSDKHQAVDQTATDPYAVVRARFLDAIRRLDVARADEELHRAATLYPPRDLVKQLAAPLLAEIGHRWAHQELGIAHEHVATNLIRNLLSSLFRLYPPSETSDTIVLSTPAGERHEFGILLAALLAAARGWRVVYLGADLPAGDILQTVRIVKARVLVVSALDTQNLQIEGELRQLAAHLPTHTRGWAAGAAIIKFKGLLETLNWTFVRDFDDLDERLAR